MLSNQAPAELCMSYAVMFDFVLAALTVVTFGLFVLCWTFLEPSSENDHLSARRARRTVRDQRGTRSSRSRALARNESLAGGE